MLRRFLLHIVRHIFFATPPAYDIMDAMSIKNRGASLLYKCILFSVSLYGVYLNSGLTRNGFDPGMFVYFTILSNLFCCIYTGVSIVRTAKDMKASGIRGTTTLLPRFKGALMVALIVTFFIYHFLLKPTLFSMELSDDFWTADVFVHYIVPFMMLFDWLLFDAKGAFRKYDPVLWALVPLGYLLFALIRAQVGGMLKGLGSYYPYFFIDVDALGPLQVFLNVLLFAAFYIGAGYIFVLADRLMGRKQKN